MLIPLPKGEEFSPEECFGCAQVFRWFERGGCWYGSSGRTAYAVRRLPGAVAVRTLGRPVTLEEARQFLGLDRVLAPVQAELSADARLAAAIRIAPGLRILRQDPWECCLSFVCAQNSSVRKIERSLERLCAEWGDAVRFPEGVTVHLPPPPDRLAEVGESALRTTGLGYRARYVSGVARAVGDGAVQPASLRGLPYPQALAELLRLPGVGRKVADCILLFALDQPAALPIDVWVRRALWRLYGDELRAYSGEPGPRPGASLGRAEVDFLNRFARDRWAEHTGYVQQVLFHALRTGSAIIGEPASGRSRP